MKIRKGFVSNSSSSSFLIDKHYLTPEQIEIIKNHREVAEGCGWIIRETPNTISGDTSMDNFDMEEYLEKQGIDMKYVFWDYGHW